MDWTLALSTYSSGRISSSQRLLASEIIDREKAVCLKMYREYRMMRRMWEIGVIEHEYCRRNTAIFPAVPTAEAIMQSVAQAKRDNANESGGRFDPDTPEYVCNQTYHRMLNQQEKTISDPSSSL